MVNRMNKRLFLIVIIVCMVLMWWGQDVSYAEENMEIKDQVDFKGHWAEDALGKWVSNGLLVGDERGTYRPNDPISRAEFAVLIDRIFNFPAQTADENPFVDVLQSTWYTDQISRVYAANIIQGIGNDKFNPEASMTRQDAAVVLVRAFHLDGTDSTKHSFHDSAEIATYAKAAVDSLHSRAYIKGRNGNRFAPRDRITRAEVVQMIDNMMGSLINSSGTYKQNYQGNVIVNTPDVKLESLVIGGDLYLTQGVAEGAVRLDGVTVKGKTFVFGGGSDSVKINDSRLMRTLIVDKRHSPVRILVSGATEIAHVLMRSGGILEEGELTSGESGFSDVNINLHSDALSREVILLGRFGQIHHRGAQANVVLERDTIVDEFTFDAIATVTGTGVIRIANMNRSGSQLSKWPDKVNFGNRVTATIEAELVDKERIESSNTNTVYSNPNPIPQSSDPLEVVIAGNAVASVIVNGNANEQTQAAAQKLIEYVEKATGVELPLFVDRLHSDKVTAENGVVEIVLLNQPDTTPVPSDFIVKTFIDGVATENENPASLIWDEVTNTVTLDVMRVEKMNVQQSIKYQVKYKDGETIATPLIIIPANPQGSLLKNSSFEAAYHTKYYAKPWEYWNGGYEPATSIVERSNEQARTGQYSLKLFGTKLVWPNQYVMVTEAGEYEYTAYFYRPLDAASSGTIQMFVNLWGEDGTELQKNTGSLYATAVSDGDWQEMKWQLTIPEKINGNRIVKALVGFEGANFAADETIFIDDVTFIRMDAVDEDVPVSGNGEQVELELPEQHEGIQIYIGKKGLSTQEQSTLLADMDADGFVIHQNGKRITIAGPTSWGTEFGVNEFLERYVGVRWLMPGEDWEDVPSMTSLVIPAGDEVREEPAFFSRAFEEQLPELPVRAKWAQNLRMHDNVKFTHNIYRMFPVAEYPQFYRPGVVDKRWDTEHPCFQADGIVDEAVRIINAYFDANPEMNSYSVGMNDTIAWCEADPSDPEAELNSIGMVDMSDIYFDWIDKVSRAVFEKHPDKYIGAYAYFNVYDPPAHVQLDPRVVVYITDERVSWGDPDMKAHGHAISKGWTGVGATVAFYDYVYGSPYLLPRTPFQLLADEYRYAASIGVGAYYSELYANFGEGPKPYLLAKLQWDPQQDVDALLDDWYERAVGPVAAEDLKAYYQIWQRFWEQDIYETQWYMNWKNSAMRTNFMPLTSPDYLREVSVADLDASRQLLESVVVKAQTSQQQKRANDLLRMFEYYELSKQSYTDMQAEIVDPSSDAEAASILDSILERNTKMDERKSLIAEFAGHDVYFQYVGALNWGGVSSKEIKALSSWLTAHPDSDIVEQVEQLSNNSPHVAVRNAMKLILLSMDGTTVKNRGFEAGLAEWMSFPDTIAELTSDANSGNQAVRVKGSSVEQDVFVESGKTYKLTFFAKTSGGTELNLIGMNFWDVPGVGLTGTHITVDSEEYQQYSVTFTPPDGFSHVTIVIYKTDGAGWVYADDFTLTEWSTDELSLASITGENGLVQAVFNKTPNEIPLTTDFTVQTIVDGIEAEIKQPAALNWNAATHTATLTVPIVTPAQQAQTVQYKVTYKGEDTRSSDIIHIAVDPQASLLRNTSFEIAYGVDDHVQPWNYGCGGQPESCTIARSDEQARTGQYSLKISGNIHAIWPSQPVTLTNYGQYEYSANYYQLSNESPNGTLQMFMIMQAADGTQLTVYPGALVTLATANANEWHQLTMSVDIPEEIDGTPVAKLLVGVEVLDFAGVGKTIYLDDITLMKK